MTVMTKRSEVMVLGGGVVVAAMINVGTWLELYYQIPHASDWVILQYNIYNGITVTGEWYRVLYMAAVGSVVLLVNMIGAWLFYKSIIVLSYFLVYSSVLVQVVLAVGSGFIIYSNRF